MYNRCRYLRVSLLNYCNLSCFYCKPKKPNTLKPNRCADVLRIEQAIAALHSFGVRKVRFTGGEPTLHANLTDLIKSTKALSADTHCAITTNGVRLGNLASDLSKAGLDSANVSLDTLSADQFHRITERDFLPKVVDGIKEAIAVIPEVKLNCVVMKGINDQHALDLVMFANELGIDIRFIEYMPTRFGSPFDRLYMSGETLRNSLPFELYPVVECGSSAARYYRCDDLRIRIGFINPVSHSFCASCDRIRLTADGQLFGCLFSGASFNLYEKIDRGLDSARQSLHELLSQKEFLGCVKSDRRDDGLPSFIEMGG